MSNTDFASVEEASGAKGRRPCAEHLAVLFHDTYERLAPDFGYETRPDTKQFDPSTPNGRLMIAVCEALLNDLPAFKALREVKLRLHFVGMPGESMFNCGTEENPRWISDWRYTINLVEHALHGSALTSEVKPTDTVRRCEVMTSSHTMLSTLRAILAVAERYDTSEMNTIRDSAKHALPRPQL